MYYKTLLPEPIKVDYIYTIHFFEYTRDFVYKGEEHNFWELVYVDSGEIGILADKEYYALSQGEIIFHGPNEYHSIWARAKYASVVVISFECSCKDMKFFNNNKILMLSQRNITLLSDIITEARAAFNEPLNIVELERMTPAKSSPFAARQIIKLRLEELLIRLIRSGDIIEPSKRIVSHTKGNRNVELVEQIDSYLKENASRRVTLDMICAKFAFSKTYIKKTYKEITGVSIIDRFINIKIDMAKKLLSEQRYNISEISEMLSFNSVHYFSRCFKKRTNMSPTAFARSIKSKQLLL